MFLAVVFVLNDKEKTAWNDFVETGGVVDYLAFSALRSSGSGAVAPKKGENGRKTDHRRTGDPRKKHR